MAVTRIIAIDTKAKMHIIKKEIGVQENIVDMEKQGRKMTRYQQSMSI